jgi:hypothetical protein
MSNLRLTAVVGWRSGVGRTAPMDGFAGRTRLPGTLRFPANRSGPGVSKRSSSLNGCGSRTDGAAPCCRRRPKLSFFVTVQEGSPPNTPNTRKGFRNFMPKAWAVLRVSRVSRADSGHLNSHRSLRVRTSKPNWAGSTPGGGVRREWGDGFPEELCRAPPCAKVVCGNRLNFAVARVHCTAPKRPRLFGPPQHL